MSYNEPFTKNNLDNCLKELGKEYRKLTKKKMPAEITLVGGASILANYGFRAITYDMDAIIQSSSFMKDAINLVGDKMGLPKGWLNDDFIQTSSYTPKLHEVSIHYKEYANCLKVRTIGAEYLVAMKLKSGREYKNDLSDVAGILWEHKVANEAISFDAIDKAVCKLYDTWEEIPPQSQEFIKRAFEKENFKELYEASKISESEEKIELIDFAKKYPGVLNEGNVNDIVRLSKQKKESINDKLDRIGKANTIKRENKIRKQEIER